VTRLEPLIDVLVHGQDIALPLGRPRAVPVDAATTAATRVWTVGWPLRTAFAARRRLAGLRLVATDVDWSVGEGDEVAGPIDALLLLLTGRTAALGRLAGPGVARLPAREAEPGRIGQAAAMTTPEPNETVQQSLPEPRDIALEMETPEQAADLEAQSDSAKGTDETTTD
jgi:hypothetical protein